MIKKFILSLVACAALAAPSTAMAHQPFHGPVAHAAFADTYKPMINDYVVNYLCQAWQNGSYNQSYGQNCAGNFQFGIYINPPSTHHYGVGFRTFSHYAASGYPVYYEWSAHFTDTGASGHDLYEVLLLGCYMNQPGVAHDHCG